MNDQSAGVTGLPGEASGSDRDGIQFVNTRNVMKTVTTFVRARARGAAFAS